MDDNAGRALACSRGRRDPPSDLVDSCDDRGSTLLERHGICRRALARRIREILDGKGDQGGLTSAFFCSL